MRVIGGIVILVYILVGVLIANNHHYLDNVETLNEIVSAILAVLLWPLITLGVNLHIGGGKGGKQGAFLVLPALNAIRTVVGGVRRRRQQTA
jgi:cell shape-determining protein MreD